MQKTALTAIMVMISLWAKSQVSLDYYLPENTSYNSNIPTPKAVIGHEVGEWHVSHDRLYFYMRAVAEASDRATLIEIGKTHEARNQVLLVITSPENQGKLDELRAEHKKLTDPNASKKVNIKNLPIVIWQGYGIHGNESSGSNAALLAAYHYAAAQGQEIDELLSNVIILLDPSMNPDGHTRFSTWVNSNRGKNLVADPNNREQNEMWPRGRTNHYMFDLNRDWLPIQQPESKNRVKQFHRWKPNIVTDHHEMGTSSTFFFQPGIPSRTNPNTPKANQELTAKIGEFHAEALDNIKSLYYSKEDYDDFYYGKGSTFPDIQGSIGILFEQASSRGHAQESPNGILTFPFTIKNQFTTTLSTAKAAVEMREELLQYQKSFYLNAQEEASKDTRKGIVFGSKNDVSRPRALADILIHHEIDVYELQDDTKEGSQSFSSGSSFFVPLNQPQYRLINIMFEEVTTFKDSLFYDVSAWTLPHAFNLDYKYVNSTKPGYTRSLYTGEDNRKFGNLSLSYAYAFKWDDYYAPKLLWKLLERNLRLKVATQPFAINGEEFPRGSIMISTQIQDHSEQDLVSLLNEASKDSKVEIYGISTGFTSGVNLGSRTFINVKKPKIAMLVESDIRSYDAGEIWHLLDYRFDIDITQIPMRVFNKIALDEYDVLILPDGRYADTRSRFKELRAWVEKGGTLIAFKDANSRLKKCEIVDLSINSPMDLEKSRQNYADLKANNGSKRTGGSIFMANLDNTNPIGYGYNKRELPVFVNSNNFFNIPDNVYSYPLQFTSKPLLSGYVAEENLKRIKRKAAIVVNKTGRGRVISFSFNPNFRAFWYGTNKLFINAIFFGSMIESGAAE